MWSQVGPIDPLVPTWSHLVRTWPPLGPILVPTWSPLGPHLVQMVPTLCHMAMCVSKSQRMYVMLLSAWLKLRSLSGPRN